MAQKFITPITIKQLASTGSDALTVFVDGEVYGRVKIEAGGRISWSDGAGSYDTNIYRSGANTLSTDDVFKAISGVVTLAVNGVPSAALPDGAIAVDTLNNAFYFRSNGTWTQVTGGGGGATVTVSDTPPASPTEGDLWFESDTAKTHVYYDSFWVEIGASGGVATLDNIGDVTAPTPTSGDFLKWNGTAWVNDAIDLGTDTTGNYVSGVSSGTGISVSHTPSEGSTATVSLDATLDNLSNVTVPSPTTNDVLQWNGTAWVNVAASTVGATTLDGLSDAVVTSPLQFQGLMYDGTNWVNSNIPDVYLVRNNTASTILKGTLVGAVGAEPSGRIDVAPFQVTGTENSELRAMGIATSNISSGVNGEVMSFGTLTGLDTRGSTASALAVGDETWAAGDILFAHPTVDGKLTNVRPQHDLAVAFITVRHASTGQIAIRIIPGNNHLEWMHDVSLVDKTSGDFLKYNGTLWVNDQINLGTDTVGDYVASLVAGTGVTLTNGTASEGGTPTIAIGQAVGTTSNVQFNDVTVDGNLTVNGTTTTLNTDTLAVEDNIIVLNSNITASPTLNAGIEVERGTSANVLVRWNETSDRWEFTNDGSVYTALGGGVAVSDTAPSSPVQGAVWFESDTLKTFVYYDSSWVEIGVTAGVAVLNDLTDVTAPSPSSGQFLKWNGTAWVPDSIPTINALDDVGNVTAPSPSSGDFLKWNGSAWVNDAIDLGTDTTGNYMSGVTAGTGISVTHTPAEGSSATVTLNATLDNLSNVTVPTPATNDVLTYNGTAWVNSPASGGGGLTVSASAPASPAEGDMWFDSDTAKTYVYYDSYWVEVGNVGGTATVLVSSAAPASPTLGTLWFDSDTAQTFAYYDSQWIEVGASGMTAIVSDTAPTSPISGLIWFKSSTGQTFTYYDSFWIELGAQGVAAYVAETAPTSPVIGQIWFNSATGGSYVYFDSTWVEIGAQPLDTIVSTIDAKGDILVGIGDNSISKVSVGSDTFVLTANSATATGLQWVSRATVANDFEIASIMGVY